MLVLGLLLLACTAAFTGLAISDNLGGGPDHNVTVVGQQIATMNGLAIFCAGLGLALLFALGVLLASGGLARHHRASRDLTAARREADRASRERDDLAARLRRIENAEPAQPAGGGIDGGHPGGGARAPASDRERVGAVRVDLPRRKHGLHLFGH